MKLTKNKFEKIKINIFKDFLYYLKQWYDEKHPNKSENDLSVRKIMQLLFLTAGIDKNSDLFLIFNNFRVYRHGYVEFTIFDYCARKHWNIDEFILNEKHLIYNNNYTPSSSISEIIKNSILKLKEKNPDLISYTEQNLSKISKSHSSWNFEIYNKRYKLLNIEKLKDEKRFFKL